MPETKDAIEFKMQYFGIKGFIEYALQQIKMI